MPSPILLRVALAGILAAGTAGCGDTRAGEAAPGSADASCRATWGALQRDLSGRETGSTPSRFTDRWAAILAGIGYHVTSAGPGDCGEPLAAERAAISALNEFEERVQHYDMQLALEQLSGSARLYLRSPVPGRAALGSAGPPVPHSRARQALDTLEDLAARADADLADAWAEADAVDLDDEQAVDKVVADLEFLAGRSKAFGRCATAVKVLRLVLRQQFAALSGKAEHAPTAPRRR